MGFTGDFMGFNRIHNGDLNNHYENFMGTNQT